MFLLKKRELGLITIGMLPLLVTPNATYGIGLGANLLTDAWWNTPGQHYIPDGAIPIHYQMEVFSADTLYVNGDGYVSGISTDWVVESVHSSKRGSLPVTGDTSQRFLLDGEQLSFTWRVTPSSGCSWPSSYRLTGVAHGWADPDGGSSAVPAVGASFSINDPHRQFTTLASTYLGGHPVVREPGIESPSLSAPYGLEKEYYGDYAPFVEQGDWISIRSPQSTMESDVLWGVLGMSGSIEYWHALPVAEGLGSSVFYTQGRGGEHLYYPADYEPWQHYQEHTWIGYTNPWPCNIIRSTDGLSVFGLCGEIVTLDGLVVPLDDGVDESRIGLYGPGFIGASFSGPAPASGFLRLYLAGDEMPKTWGGYVNNIEVTVTPEPSLLGLLTVGGLTLIRRRR